MGVAPHVDDRPSFHPIWPRRRRPDSVAVSRRGADWSSVSTTVMGVAPPPLLNVADRRSSAVRPRIAASRHRPLPGRALVTNQRPPQRDGSLLRVPAGRDPSARSRVGERGRRRRCSPVAPPNPIASTTPLIGRRQRLSCRRRRRTAAVVDDHPSSGMPCVAHERQSHSGPSPAAGPLPSRSSLRHGDGHAAFADVRHGRRPFFSSMGPAVAASPSHHASLRASTPAERWSRISARPRGTARCYACRRRRFRRLDLTSGEEDDHVDDRRLRLRIRLRRCRR